jgi:hypothetical protein
VDWTQPIPVRTNSQAPAPPTEKHESSTTNANTTTPGTPPRDYEWEAYQQHVEVDGEDSWEKLPAEPEETNDDVFEDENDEEDQIATDLTIRIGRMIICENVTGFFRPQYAEEVHLTPFDYIQMRRILSLQLLSFICASLGNFFRSILLRLHPLLGREHLSRLRFCLQNRCRHLRPRLLYSWDLQRPFPKEMNWNILNFPLSWKLRLCYSDTWNLSALLRMYYTYPLSGASLTAFG